MFPSEFSDLKFLTLHGIDSRILRWIQAENLVEFTLVPEPISDHDYNYYNASITPVFCVSTLTTSMIWGNIYKVEVRTLLACLPVVPASGTE